MNKTNLFFLIAALASILTFILALVTGHSIWWVCFGLNTVSTYFFWMGLYE